MSWLSEKWKELWSSRRTKYYFVTVIFVVSVLFLSENNIIRWINVMFDISNQEEIIREYSENIKEADRRLEVLGSDLDTLETFARENFYFHKADEDLVQEMKYNEIICCEHLADWESAKQKVTEYLNEALADNEYGEKTEIEVTVTIDGDGVCQISENDLLKVEEALFPGVV